MQAEEGGATDPVRHVKWFKVEQVCLLNPGKHRFLLYVPAALLQRSKYGRLILRVTPKPEKKDTVTVNPVKTASKLSEPTLLPGTHARP